MCKALENYLTNNHLTATEFAEMVGCKQATISRYLSGARLPTKAKMRKIFIVTQGQVSPNDFYNLPELPGVTGGSSKAGRVVAPAPCSDRKNGRSYPAVLPGQVDLFTGAVA